MANLSYKPLGRVTVEEFDHEILLLDTERDVFFRTNLSGYLIWDAISSGGTKSDAAEALTERFGIERERAESDVDALVSELIANDLLQECG